MFPKRSEVEGCEFGFFKESPVNCGVCEGETLPEETLRQGFFEEPREEAGSPDATLEVGGLECAIREQAASLFRREHRMVCDEAKRRFSDTRVSL